MAKSKTAIVPVGLDLKPALAKVETELLAAIQPYVDAKAEKYRTEYAAVPMIKVTDPASRDAAKTLVDQIVAELDGLLAVKAAGPGALGSLSRKLHAVFKPLVDQLEAPRTHLNKQIGGFIVANKHAQQQAYQAAAQHHLAGEHAEASQSLVAAHEAIVLSDAPKGFGVRERWEVASINLKELPDEWKIADEKRINAHARACPVDQTPSIPGVVFVKGTEETNRRK